MPKCIEYKWCVCVNRDGSSSAGLLVASILYRSGGDSFFLYRCAIELHSLDFWRYIYIYKEKYK